MAVYELQTPFDSAEIAKLRVGDLVYVSGKAFTCRSRLHRRVFDENHPSPKAAVERDLLIHVGPIVLRHPDSYELVSFMPTSSIRFEKWGARAVDEWGLRMIIGKTTMGEETMAMMQKKKCVHVSPQCVSPNFWVQNINITDVELSQVDETRPIYIKQHGAFFALLELNVKGNHTAEAKLLKLTKRQEEE